MAKEDTKTLAVLAHVLAIFTGFVGPLIILLVSESDEAKKHAKAALNWQFSLMIYLVVSFILILILVGILLVIALYIMNIIFCVIAAVKASNREIYTYPLSIRFFDV